LFPRRSRHTRFSRDWSSDVCSSDLYRDARRFPAFYGTFVVPRDASFTYLRRGGADWLDRVALKTGSLTQPVSVYGIAGYLRKQRSEERRVGRRRWAVRRIKRRHCKP